jgi:hypothetical protein
MAKQMECRVVITNHDNGTFSMGMFDPRSGRHEPLGTHRTADKDRVVRGLVQRIEAEGHLLSFSEVSGKR